jgi:hypothetical protein
MSRAAGNPSSRRTDAFWRPSGHPRRGGGPGRHRERGGPAPGEIEVRRAFRETGSSSISTGGRPETAKPPGRSPRPWKPGILWPELSPDGRRGGRITETLEWGSDSLVERIGGRSMKSGPDHSSGQSFILPLVIETITAAAGLRGTETIADVYGGWEPSAWPLPAGGTGFRRRILSRHIRRLRRNNRPQRAG